MELIGKSRDIPAIIPGSHPPDLDGFVVHPKHHYQSSKIFLAARTGPALHCLGGEFFEVRDNKPIHITRQDLEVLIRSFVGNQFKWPNWAINGVIKTLETLCAVEGAQG